MSYNLVGGLSNQLPPATPGALMALSLSPVPSSRVTKLSSSDASAAENRRKNIVLLVLPLLPVECSLCSSTIRRAVPAWLCTCKGDKTRKMGVLGWVNLSCLAWGLRRKAMNCRRWLVGLQVTWLDASGRRYSISPSASTEESLESDSLLRAVRHAHGDPWAPEDNMMSDPWRVWRFSLVPIALTTASSTSSTWYRLSMYARHCGWSAVGSAQRKRALKRAKFRRQATRLLPTSRPASPGLPPEGALEIMFKVRHVPLQEVQVVLQATTSRSSSSSCSASVVPLSLLASDVVTSSVTSSDTGYAAVTAA